jgi:hypothetical protein
VAGDTISLTNNPELATSDFKMRSCNLGRSSSAPMAAFGNDDFGPSNLAPAGVRTHIAENNENVSFLPADFGPLEAGLRGRPWLISWWRNQLLVTSRWTARD